MSNYVAYFDGASRGNPGSAGAGCAIFYEENLIWQRAEPLGICTNNVAEWIACLTALRKLESLGAFEPTLYGDSSLVINQLNGKWKINKPELAEIAALAIPVAKKLKAKALWVPREDNKLADKLSNRALDEGAIEETFFSDLGQNKLSSTIIKCEALQKEENIYELTLKGRKYLLDLAQGTIRALK